MNVGRGLFRAWVVASTLWIAAAGIVAYEVISPTTVRGSFQPMGVVKGELKPSEVDYGKPFYETMRSPSAEKLSVTFRPVNAENRIKWDKDLTMTIAEMSDGSRVYMSANYNDADKDYIAKQFWDQRWNRYAQVAGIIALWALIPCIVIFIFGHVIMWIGRGFTRT